MKIKNISDKKERSLIIILSVAASFSACIFNQFDVLFRNQVEFGIQPQEVLLGFILLFVVTLAVCMTGLFLLARYSKKGFKIALAVVLGLTLAGYIQVLFLNGHYNGAFADYAGEDKPLGGAIKVVNLFVWLLVCLLPTLFLIIEKRTQKQFFKKLVTLVAITIFVMQAVGFATAAPEADFRRYDKSFYFSVDRQLELSKQEKENIVVFLLDRADVAYADEVFKDNPRATENFEGFTYYRGNTGEYGQTFPSVVSMLTGESFDQTESRSGFSKRAWANATLFDELQARDYIVNGLIDELSTYYDIDEVSDKFDNIVFVNDDRKVNQWQAVKSMTALSLQRTLPYALKSMAGFDYPKDLDRIVSNRKPDFFPNKISASSDNAFEQKVSSTGLSAINNQNTFSFVHLNASHTPLNWKQATFDIFNMLGEYFDQMKEQGIFENSTIILTADHGAKRGTNASLFIKEKGAGGGAMKTNSTAKLSNAFFLSTIFELIGAEDKKPASSYFDVIYRGATPERYFREVDWNVGNHCKFIEKRIITD